MQHSFVETERQNKTSWTTRRRLKMKSNAKENIFLLTDRPFTTSLGRTQNIYNYRNLEMAENEL